MYSCSIYWPLIQSRGPNWIHGTDHNPILSLARETGTTAVSIEESVKIFDGRGSLLTREKADAISDLVWGIISDAFKYSNETPNIPQSRSLKDFFIEKLEEKEISNDKKKLVMQLAEMWGAFIGDSFERQSLKYFWLEECIDGGKPDTNEPSNQIRSKL